MYASHYLTANEIDTIYRLNKAQQSNLLSIVIYVYPTEPKLVINLEILAVQSYFGLKHLK